MGGRSDMAWRWVAAGALLLAAVAILLSVVLFARIGEQNDKIVETGRVAIESGCLFDNKRAHAIRGILRRGLRTQTVLYRRGALSRERYLVARRESKRAIREIEIRDCRRAAGVLGN